MNLVLAISLYIIMIVVGLSISYWIIKIAVKNGVKAAFSDMRLAATEQNKEIGESITEKDLEEAKENVEKNIEKSITRKSDEDINSEYDNTGRKYKWYE